MRSNGRWLIASARSARICTWSTASARRRRGRSCRAGSGCAGSPCPVAPRWSSRPKACAPLATAVWGLNPGRVRHIPNGVDAAALARQARQPFGLRRHADERLFGTLAGLRPEKNLERLLRIAALLPEEIPWRLVIAGEGAQRAALEALARELGLAERVAFTGFVDRPGSVLGELDVYVLTSDTEQMPIAVLEAMAAGLPVLATDVGDLRLMLPPASRDACLFGRGQEPAFAARLAALLRAPDERRRLGALNREKAAEFSLEAMVGALRAPAARPDRGGMSQRPRPPYLFAVDRAPHRRSCWTARRTVQTGRASASLPPDQS